MRVLIAPNAFKGSLSVLEACRAFAKGTASVHPGAQLDWMPIADGGDGLMDALLFAKTGRVLKTRARGPLGARVTAPWALLKDGTACVEMARASGLALVERREPMRASTEGTGDLIAAAAAKGAKLIVVGLGGTASSDGGTGMARALGWRFLDARGRDVKPGAEGLLELARVIPGPKLGAKVIGVTDVVNPLLGPRGSARVYGPQKGASPAQVRRIERGLANLARLAGPALARKAGAGAAGGCGFGLMAFLDAELAPGAAFVLRACGAEKRVKAADAVLSGEGRLDGTSFYGKAPVELARLARRARVPAALVCGQVDEAARRRLRLPAVSFAEAGAPTPERSISEAARWAARAAARAVQGLALCALLAGVVRAADCAATDADYFKRNEPGKLDAALSVLEKAPQDDAGCQWRLSRALVRRGERKDGKKARLEDFKAAEDAGERAVKASSGTADAHFWLGVAHGRRGQTQGMMKSLFLVGPIRREMEAAIALDPSHGGAHHVLGELLWQLPGFAGGDKKKALAEYEKALELSPRYSANYVPLAEAYAKMGRRDEALKILDRLKTVTEPADPAQFPDDLKDAEELRKKL